MSTSTGSGVETASGSETAIADETETGSTTHADSMTSTGSDETTGSGELPDPGPCAVDLSQLVATQVDHVVTIGNETFEIEFDEFGSNGQATRLGVGANDNVLHAGPALERAIGVDLWPSWHSWQELDPSPDSDPAVILLQAGPGVASYHVVWHAHNGVDGRMEGQTMFTVHPDGRIIRDDYVHVIAQPDGGEWLKTHLVLDPAVFEEIIGAGEDAFAYTVPKTMAPDGIEHFLGPDSGFTATSMCARDEDDGIVVGFGVHELDRWYAANGGLPVEAGVGFGLRGTRAQVGGGAEYGTITLAFDWAQELATPSLYPQQYRASSLIVAESRPAGSSGSCECVAAQYEAFADPPPLQVEGGEVAQVTINMDQEGGDPDGDGYYEGGGWYGVTAGADSGTLIVTLGAGSVPTLALRVEETAASPETVDVFLNGVALQEGEDFLVTPSGSGSGFYVFLGRQFDQSMRLRIVY